jgi:N-acetylmuramoyl-L-alanine amidase
MRRMRGHFARITLSAGAAILIATPFNALRAADLNNARVWAGPDYTRVVFDLSGPQSYKLIQSGDKIILQLSGGRLGGSFNKPAAQGLFKGLDSTSQGSDVRLTASVAPNSRPKSFLLSPSGHSGYRLVLDLYPGSSAAAVVSASPVTSTAAPLSNALVTAQNQDDAATPVSDIAPSPDARSNRKSVLTTRQAAVLLDSQSPVIVAIDPGHGGKDQGAHGPNGTLEKNITLAVGRNLAAMINRQPGMKAFLTRDGDYFIPLKTRYDIARQHKADLFVSIHADSYTTSDARGSSVWVLSSRGKSSEAAGVLADRENSSDLIGGVSLASESDSLASVLLDMQQGWAVQASETVADNVLKALSSLGPTHRGYVEHANFVVLRSPDVPSILVETAFISNPAEEQKLRDASHQQELANAVMGGIRGYFETNPPPGTWFAADAARRKGVLVASSSDNGASTKAAVTKSIAADAPTTLVDTSTSPRADADVQDMHRVTAGESLRSIARQYGVSIGSLKSANNISSNSVHAGMVLTIPAS